MEEKDKSTAMTRKTFLRTGVKAGALGVMAGSLGMSLPRSASAAVPGSWAATAKVDVHAHMVPANYATALAGIGITGPGPGAPWPAWNADIHVAAMDTYGIAVSILSLSAPGVYLSGPSNPNPGVLAVSLASSVNDTAAAAVAKYPTRFGFFATLPMPLITESIAEAQRAIQLGADGFIMLSNIDNKYVGHSDYAPLMEYLNSISARVFIHPNSSPLTVGLGVGVKPPGAAPFQPTPESFFEYTFETTRAVVNMIANNIPNKYPNIKFILAHAGGTVPYIAGRLGYLLNIPPIAAMYPNGLTPVFQSYYYDTALSPFAYPQEALRSLVPKSQILFGSDYPLAPPPVVASELAALESTDVLKAAQRDDVGYKNAKALFPSLKRKL